MLDSNKVRLRTRFLNFLIDTVAFFVVVVALIFILLFVLQYKTNQDILILTYFGIIIIWFFAYYIILEHKYQKTLGKFITKTKVITVDGNKPELGNIVRRTFCRLIPLDSASFLFSRNGIHDYLSNTKVVKDEQ